MAEIDHHLRCQTRFLQPCFHLRYVFSTVVRLFTAAQYDMAITITAGVHDSRVAPLGHRQEAVRRASRINGVNGDLDGAISAIFETHRA